MTPVMLYTKPGCVQCVQTKKVMAKHDIEFTEIDITADGEGHQLVLALGYAAVPVVTAGDDHWYGFRPERIKALVDHVAVREPVAAGV